MFLSDQGCGFVLGRRTHLGSCLRQSGSPIGVLDGWLAIGLIGCPPPKGIMVNRDIVTRLLPSYFSVAGVMLHRLRRMDPRPVWSVLDVSQEWQMGPPPPKVAQRLLLPTVRLPTS